MIIEPPKLTKCIAFMEYRGRLYTRRPKRCISKATLSLRLSTFIEVKSWNRTAKFFDSEYKRRKKPSTVPSAVSCIFCNREFNNKRLFSELKLQPSIEKILSCVLLAFFSVNKGCVLQREMCYFTSKYTKMCLAALFRRTRWGSLRLCVCLGLFVRQPDHGCQLILAENAKCNVFYCQTSPENPSWQPWVELLKKFWKNLQFPRNSQDGATDRCAAFYAL